MSDLLSRVLPPTGFNPKGLPAPYGEPVEPRDPDEPKLSNLRKP